LDGHCITVNSRRFGDRQKAVTVTISSETARFPSASGTIKAAGWYPDRINPTLQNYWNGHSWSAQRQWMSGRWFDVEMTPYAGGVLPAGAVPHHARPSGPIPYQNLTRPLYTPRPSIAPHRTSTRTVTLAMMGLLVCSVIIIVGSLTPWITVAFGVLSSSVNGNDAGISTVIGVDGWVTFAGGILLFVLVGFTAFTGERAWRVCAVGLALAVGGFATYDLVRIIQKISTFSAASNSSGKVASSILTHFDVNVGWGLIILLVGAFGAILFALGDLKSD
jgi:hypothetical protein